MASISHLSPAPIALFVYNRPDHTKATLDALQKNSLASDSPLIIFSDGAKSESHAPKVREVRALLQGVQGFKSVTIVERPENFGLARSIIDGVSSIIKQHGRVIVMEDDLVTSPFFLTFMNDALEKYKFVPEVLHISGSIFPLQNPEKLPPTFFYRATSCWGWATWDRAWQVFEPDSTVLLGQLNQKGLEHAFDIEGRYPYTRMLKDQALGRVNSWAIRWYASVFLKGGLCLHPSYSLVNNIGHDGSGMHCIISDAFEADLAKTGHINMMDPLPLNENSEAVSQIRLFFKRQRRPFYQRVLMRIKRHVFKIIS